MFTHMALNVGWWKACCFLDFDRFWAEFSLGHDLKFLSEPDVGGTAADEYLELARLDTPDHILIQQGKVVGVEDKPNGLFLTRLQRHAFETAELLFIDGDAADLVMDVELADLVAFSGTCVRDFNRYRTLPPSTLLIRHDDQVAIGKTGITKSIAEGIERAEYAGVVLGLRPGLAIPRLRPRFIGEIPLDLAGSLRKGDREFAARVVIAEEGLCDSLAAELVGEPGFEDGGDIAVGPIDGKGLAVDQYQ